MGSCCCTALDADQSVLIDTFTSRYVRHGPGWVCYNPLASTKRFTKQLLTAEQYLKVTHLNVTPHNATSNHVSSRSVGAGSGLGPNGAGTGLGSSDNYYNHASEADDLIEHVAGPCAYQLDDAYAKVEGPLQKIELSVTEFIICTDPKTGSKTTIEGPMMYMPKPYEIVGNKFQKLFLLNNQYCLITDTKTSHITVKSGPATFALQPFDKAGPILNKLELANTQYAIVTDNKTGHKSIIEGPTLYVPGPYETVSTPNTKISLNKTQYVYVTNSENGAVLLVKGPNVFSLKPFETAGTILDILPLDFTQYVFIKDKQSGSIRVEKGPNAIILGQFDELIMDANKKSVRQAVIVDENHAVHVKDVSNGEEKLITEKQQYVPATPNIVILDVVGMTKLEPYQSVILIDMKGKLSFISGKEVSGFFTPPFNKLLSQKWSVNGDTRKLDVSIFDTRPKDMDFVFSVRSADNVEIYMKVNVYWEIMSLEKLVATTNDPPQDICNHIRSQLLSLTSRMSTKDLMEYSTSDLIKSIYDEDNSFYSARGVHVSRIDILEKKCADIEVEKTYKAIIDQKIERIKNLEKQKGENETNLEHIKGKIEQEKQNFELLEQRMKNINMENKEQGGAEGEKIRMFLDGLGEEMDDDTKLRIFLELERTKRIETVATKAGTLYVKPEDVDFNMNIVKVDSDKDLPTGINVNM